MNSLFPEYEEPQKKKKKSKKTIKVKMPAELLPYDRYDTCVINFSGGIDSTGCVHEMLKLFPREKIIINYQDTGLEYLNTWPYIVRLCQHLSLRPPVRLAYPRGFKGYLLNRGKWPGPGKFNRWCTSILKTDIFNKWVVANRPLLGSKVLVISGERRQESPRREKYEPTVLHHTHLLRGGFTCHWHRPVLDYEKGLMFEWGRELGLDPHPIYQTQSRCSCYSCIMMSDDDIKRNMRNFPELFADLLEIEREIGHTFRHKISLNDLWKVCDQVEDEVNNREITLFDDVEGF